MAQGHECMLAFGREQANCSDVPTVRIGTPMDYRLHGAESRLLDDSGFGSRRATRRFLDWVREYDPDVIWLHNVHGYYIHLGELFPYLRGCGKPIFWTLHDCWSFTGHCAYFDYVGCDRWRTGCHNCPQKHAYPASILSGQQPEKLRKKAGAVHRHSRCDPCRPLPLAGKPGEGELPEGLPGEGSIQHGEPGDFQANPRQFPGKIRFGKQNHPSGRCQRLGRAQGTAGLFGASRPAGR